MEEKLPAHRPGRLGRRDFSGKSPRSGPGHGGLGPCDADAKEDPARAPIGRVPAGRVIEGPVNRAGAVSKGPLFSGRRCRNYRIPHAGGPVFFDDPAGGPVVGSGDAASDGRTASPFGFARRKGSDGGGRDHGAFCACPVVRPSSFAGQIGGGGDPAGIGDRAGWFRGVFFPREISGKIIG